jgi:hypothetical protein
VNVGASKKTPGKPATAAAADRKPAAGQGHLAVSELVSDRAAAPSPFGDDQVFPLPVERLNYIPTLS